MFLVKFAVILCAAIAAHGYSLGPVDVVFHLYTRSNPQVSQPLLPSIASIMTSSFSPLRRTVVTIHSNGEGVSGNFNAFVIPAHLAVEDVNILAVDWSPGSSMYTAGLGNVPQLGEVVAEFLNILIVNFGYTANSIRIVGIGLGAHAAGIAARKVNGNVPHIVALDPSLIGWTHHPDILNKDDAGVVEVLHTSAGIIGYDYPLGDLDFYANGGVLQTGCGTDSACAHSFAYVYYAESITAETNNGLTFIGTACDSYDNAINLRCTGSRDVVFGGSNTKTSASGIYIFLTNIMPPFARG